MKRITSIMLSVILALTVVPMFSICAAATPTSTLIPISTKEQFYNIRNDVTANYYLTNDIVFDERDFLKNGKFYNDGYGWLGVDGGYHIRLYRSKTINGTYTDAAGNNAIFSSSTNPSVFLTKNLYQILLVRHFDHINHFLQLAL